MEKADYRDNLERINELCPGKILLNMADLRAITGFKDSRAIHRRFPLNDRGEISAPTLARALCSEVRR